MALRFDTELHSMRPMHAIQIQEVQTDSKMASRGKEKLLQNLNYTRA